MNIQELQQLGITPEVLIDRLVERMEEHFLGDTESIVPDFENRVEKAVKARVDSVMDTTMNEQVIPKLPAMLDELVLRPTNQWGEPKGEPVTITEFFVKRVDEYIREQVNYQGKTKAEEGYNWTAKTTRIAHMIHEHLHYEIARAIAKILGDANSVIRKQLEEACKVALSTIIVKVNTEVKDK